jgi:hypothetical protein
MTKRQEAIRAALCNLQGACGLDNSESSTEALFGILTQAIEQVDWDIVEESHAEGLCYDVNALLAEAIDSVASHEKN